MPGSKLVLVEQRVPTRREAALLRPKQMAHTPGQLQCPHCGGRSWLTVHNGGYMNPETKRVKGATVLHASICSFCWQNSRIQTMSILC
ncbi:MAG TPA: hypothetical protein VF681_09680 [Abditibacteriaceae bacterium]